MTSKRSKKLNAAHESVRPGSWLSAKEKAGTQDGLVICAISGVSGAKLRGQARFWLMDSQLQSG